MKIHDIPNPLQQGWRHIFLHPLPKKEATIDILVTAATGTGEYRLLKNCIYSPYTGQKYEKLYGIAECVLNGKLKAIYYAMNSLETDFVYYKLNNIDGIKHQIINKIDFLINYFPYLTDEQKIHKLYDFKNILNKNSEP